MWHGSYRAALPSQPITSLCSPRYMCCTRLSSYVAGYLFPMGCARRPPPFCRGRAAHPLGSGSYATVEDPRWESPRRAPCTCGVRRGGWGWPWEGLGIMGSGAQVGGGGADGAMCGGGKGEAGGGGVPRGSVTYSQGLHGQY